MCDRYLRIQNLTFASLTAQLAYGFHKKQDPQSARVVVGKAASGRHGGELASGAETTTLDVRSPFSLLTEAEILQGEKHGDRE
jgi:hypothetical protein